MPAIILRFARLSAGITIPTASGRDEPSLFQESLNYVTRSFANEDIV